MTTEFDRRRPLAALVAIGLGLLLTGAASGQGPGVRTASTWNQSTSVTPPAVIPASLLQIGRGPGGGDSYSDGRGYQIQVDPPGPERIFRLESEAALFDRLRQQGRDQKTGPYDPTADTFPEEKELSRDTYSGRQWDPKDLLVEPAYVCHKRLLFEQRNEERFGWDLGAIQPFVSVGYFWFDVATLPYHIATRPQCCFDCSAGYCLPGDPVPYVLYPPEISLTGALAEVGTAVVLFAMFP